MIVASKKGRQKQGCHTPIIVVDPPTTPIESHGSAHQIVEDQGRSPLDWCQRKIEGKNKKSNI